MIAQHFPIYYSTLNLPSYVLTGDKESQAANGRLVQESVPPESASQESCNDSSSNEDQSDVYDDQLDQQPLVAPNWATVFTGDSAEELPQPVPVAREKHVSTLKVQVAPPPLKLSPAMDARLELGYEMVAERHLTMLELIQEDAVTKGLTTKAHLVNKYQVKRPSTSQRNDDVPPPDIASLSSCFNRLFSQTNSQDIPVCSLAELWLKFKASCAALTLQMSSVAHVLSRAAHSCVVCSRTHNATLQLLKAFVEGQLVCKALQRDQTELKALLNNPDLLQFLLGVLTSGHAVSHASPVDIRSIDSFVSVLRTAVDGYQDRQLLALLQNLLLRLLLALGSHG